MNNAYFVTGTDTEIGKTFVTCALLHRYRAQGYRAHGMKPIAAGVDATGNNEDVMQIAAASSSMLEQSLINPYCYRNPIAPHIAAEEEAIPVDPNKIQVCFDQIAEKSQIVLVEGVGGFKVPLGPHFDSAQLATTLGLPVILVVGMRLGCLNHALLTADAIEACNLKLAGWVANCVQAEMSRLDQNIEALQQRLQGPLLGIVPHQADKPSPVHAAPYLKLPG